MLLTAACPVVSTYCVEVSGWDSFQTFFVEKCELEWNKETGKHVTLLRSLRPGTMIFVRLLQPTSSDQSFPVPYRAEPTGVVSDEQHQFRVSQVHPYTGTKMASHP
jgi:hypothetical protein